MTVLRSLYRCLGSHGGRDDLLWHADLKPHAYGDFSIAVVQANARLEDQGQVLASPSATYVGVYDGHGGPEASRFLNEHLISFLKKFVAEHGGISAEVIKKAFNKAEEEFLHLVRVEFLMRPQIASVGSCCLLGVISEDLLYVANLGDSRAVIGRRVPGVIKDIVVAERLSIDHNVADVEVRKEVQELHPDDSDIVVHARGSWRIKGIIQVSRSIGDFYLKKSEFYKDPTPQNLGNPVPLKRPLITAEPSILVRKLKPDDLFLIFASDGLWEHLSDEAAVDIVTRNPRAGIARRLIRAALEEAAKKREVQYDDIRTIEKGVRRFFHDDVTVIVVFLDHRRGYSGGGIKHHALGCTVAPVDVYSLNADRRGVRKNISRTKTSNIELNGQSLGGHGQRNT